MGSLLDLVYGHLEMLLQLLVLVYGRFFNWCDSKEIFTLDVNILIAGYLATLHALCAFFLVEY